MADASAQSSEAWAPAVAAALLAILVGIGLARFAYSPLIPVVIAAGWLSPGEAAYLGAGNLVGYLLGAWMGRLLASRWPVPALLRAAMLAATISFLASVLPSFVWLLSWRVVAGIAGGILMVLAAPFVLPTVPDARRGFASGIVFAGVGFGVVLSGTLVPLLATVNAQTAWLALALLSASATGLAWGWWPSVPAGVDTSPQSAGPNLSEGRSFRLLGPVYLVYALVAVGLVPHMVFLVDYIARGLGAGLGIGGGYWVLFGLGALTGPVVAGRVSDALGYRTTLRIALLLQFICVALPAVSQGTGSLVVSSIVVGAAVSGTVPLVLGRVHGIVSDPAARRAAWSTATICFAVGQAAAGYGYSVAFVVLDGAYRSLFAIGATALAGALAIALTLDLNRPESPAPIRRSS